MEAVDFKVGNPEAVNQKAVDLEAGDVQRVDWKGGAMGAKTPFLA
jgi:hypothetical protein